jgi:diadenosine tetraphosphatase ApaH/serine/threonine PP2A family protein phosphatase
MRLAVLSDIHANIEALIEVLADLEAVGADEVICLGDHVGYGPDPEAVVTEVRRRGLPSVVGNHELALLDPAELQWFNPLAQLSLLRTAAMVSPETLDYLRSLPASLEAHGGLFVHGFPPDSATTYLFEVPEDLLALTLADLPQRGCFVGHTHDLAMATLARGRLAWLELQPRPIPLPAQGRFLVNVGSVGQPRDGDLRAKYVLWDQRADTIELRRVAYDAARTAARIRALGLPEAHALRLELKSSRRDE